MHDSEAPTSPPSEQVSTTLGTLDRSFHLIGIGASAGGLEALRALVTQIPDNCPHSFVVIQHLSPDYKSLMSELIQRETNLKVSEVADGMEVQPGHIYLIPPKSNMIIRGTSRYFSENTVKALKRTQAPMKFELFAQPPRHKLNLPIDIFFHSLAEAVGERAICVVLSGTGSDGSRGLMSVKDAGGLALAQDPETAEFSGMPQSAIMTGNIDLILPPADIPREILNYINNNDADLEAKEPLPADQQKIFTEILQTVSAVSGIDYTRYKPPTLRRRIARRMVLCSHNSLESYLKHLKKNTDECRKLATEFLVGVTGFFRDISAWETLRDDLLENLFATGDIERPLKIWSVGCSTGEEAYTISAILEHYRQEHNITRDFRVFATDVSQTSVDYARNGVYPSSAAQDVPDEYRGLLFRLSTGQLSVREAIRKKIVFANHDALQNPPYVATDLIICRNVLIYFATTEQARLLDNFSYSLRDNGILFLGLSETADRNSSAFTTFNKRNRIFVNTYPKSHVRTLSNVRRQFEPLDIHSSAENLSNLNGLISNKKSENEEVSFADQILRQADVCAILLDRRQNVVRTVGDYRRILQLPDDGFSNQLMELLPRPLNTVVSQSLFSKEAATETGWRSELPIDLEEGRRRLSISVRHLSMIGDTPQQSLVLLQINALGVLADSATPRDKEGAEQLDAYSATLEAELRITRQALETSISELAESNEELQTANEELMATNEELQATNEEMQSVNEELYAVNAELNEKIVELETVNADIDTLLEDASVHALFVDDNLRIRRFSAHTASLFSLTPRDMGRPLTHFTSRLLIEDHRNLMDRLKLMIEAMQDSHTLDDESYSKARVFRATDQDGNIYLVRIMVYKEPERRKAAAMISFVDVTELSRLQMEIEYRSDLLEGVLEAQTAGFWDWDLVNNTEYLSPAFKAMFGYADDEMENSPESWKKIIHPDDLPGVMETFEAHIASKGRAPYDNEVRYYHKNGSIVWVWCRGRVVEWNEKGEPLRMVGCHIDITHLKDRETRTREEAEEIRRFAYVAAHDMREPLSTMNKYLDLLTHEIDIEASDDLSFIKETLTTSGRRMHRLVEGLLEFAQLYDSKVEFTDIDLNEVTAETLSALSAQIDSTKADITVDPLPSVMGKSSLLAHVMQNLITNALKYQDKEQIPKIHISGDVHDGVCTIKVDDNGIGIEPDYRDYVFNMFTRLHTQSEYEGTGLGLAACRRIITLMSGSIWVEDSPLGGAGLRFRLKAA